ncbi:MAG: hypothetical protein OSB69_10745 [Alphaproteobacteria bacterium]|jgi:hypothetical protein|nr:hypothetical protein [Alphaproteobacteria bacterium]
MRREHKVQIGERFRSARRSALSHGGGAVFEVGDILVEGCVVPHARLFDVSNPSDRRLISVDALKDTNLYFAVDFQSIDTAEPVTDP